MKMLNTEQRKRRLVIELSAQLHGRLMQAARVEEVSAADIVRQAIRAQLNRAEQQPVIA
jgi:predicted transcriptional regulator